MANDNDCKDWTYIDAYSPKEMACRAEKIGVAKAKMDFLSTFVLAIMAGAFVALGACFYTTAITGINIGLGLTRIVGGVAFCLGLILIVISGAELFTGNTLIVIATISRKVSIAGLIRNWAIVYAGNMVGSLGVALLIYFTEQWKMGEMAVGATAYNIAGLKLSIPWGTAFCSGILCNALVCLAVWMCYSARSTTDKILAIIFPITAFVVLGFEHSVANMFFVPYGIALSKTGAFVNHFTDPVTLKYAPSLFTTHRFLVHNLLPVTLGNIVGGSLLIGAIYWLVYLRADQRGIEE
jgi:formate transporter